MEEITRELECQICLNLMRPPIRLCLTGHSFCEPCFNRIPNCPVCKKRKTEMRNFTLEKLLEKVDLPCKNEDYGCEFADKGWGVKTHELVCEFKPIKCPFRVYEKKCDWEGHSSSLVSHVKECTGPNAIKLPFRTAYSTFHMKKVLRLIMAEYGQIFMFGFSQLNSVVRVNTYIIAGEPTTNVFCYKFSIHDEEEKNLVTVGGRCFTFPNYAHELMNDTECIMFPVETLKRACGDKIFKLNCKLELYIENK